MWEAADVPNPEYAPNPSLYKFDDLRHVGFELWQVKAGPGACASCSRLDPRPDPAWFQRLKLTHDEPLSNVALDVN